MSLYPILEFDPEREAIIEASRLLRPIEELPPYAVICFFGDVIAHFVEQGLAQEVYVMRSEMGPHPIYRLDLGLGSPVTLFHPGIGGPMAAAAIEQTIALGCRRFIACGGAGVLDRGIQVGHLVVPTSAVRDEGTSYHYLPPGREVEPTLEAVRAIEAVLAAHYVPYLKAKTWTTDAVFRETRARAAQRKAEGCLTVEMEAASMFAVAQFRDVPLGQILYGGDNLDADEWDKRGWQDRWSVRERLVSLAAEACLLL
ncbi:MAG: nucleoside phosphorylase [Anaerolineae bacterium]|nr:nucleoside phosphorylase [Anaerolineae bacterium]